MLIKILDICDCANTLDHQSQTPLHILLSSECDVSEDNATALLAKMPTIDHRDHNGRTVMHHSMHKNGAVLDAVINRREALNVQDNEGMTSLHVLMDDRVFGRDSLSRLVRLIEGGADVHVTDSKNRTPLDVFIESIMIRNARLVEDGMLVAFKKHGSEIGAGHDGMARVKLVRKLITHSAMDDARVVLASVYPVLEDSNVSLASAEDIDLGELFSGFEEADEWEQLRILRFLGENGAADEEILKIFEYFNENAEPKLYGVERFKGEWRLTFCLAAERGDPVATSLEREAMIRASATGDLAALGTFIDDMEWGYEDAVDHLGRTPLSRAAEAGLVEIVVFWLDKWVSTEVVDRFGRTALYWAARYGMLDVVGVLVEHGALVASHVMDVRAVYEQEEFVVFLRDFVKGGGD